jgi:RND family efflux transporter MFP subunit
VELGELVSPGQPLITGLSLETLRVNVDVPQSMFHAVRTIGKAFVYVDDERIDAEQLTYFPVADAEANTFRVRVDLPDGSATIYPGMFVKVGFVVGESKRLLVPSEAVVRRSELSAVYVVADDKVTLRQVRLGRRYGDSQEVLAGLSEGERVASDPVTAGIHLKEQAEES